MKNIKCVVFDWDGTVMDSIPRIISSMRTAASLSDLPVPSEKAVANIIGLSLQKAINEIFPTINERQNKALIHHYTEQFRTQDPTPTPVFDGIAQMIESLKNNNVLVSIATGKARPGLERVLELSEIKHLFDFSIAADEAESKPHPDMLHQTMQRFSIQPTEVVMVGDTTHDMNMANNAGTYGVAVTFGAHDIEQLKTSKPEVITTNVPQLSEVLHRAVD